MAIDRVFYFPDRPIIQSLRDSKILNDRVGRKKKKLDQSAYPDGRNVAQDDATASSDGIKRIASKILPPRTERNEILRIFQTSIESSKREWLGSKIIVDEFEIRNELFSSNRIDPPSNSIIFLNLSCGISCCPSEDRWPIPPRVDSFTYGSNDFRGWWAWWWWWWCPTDRYGHFSNGRNRNTKLPERKSKSQILVVTP